MDVSILSNRLADPSVLSTRFVGQYGLESKAWHTDLQSTNTRTNVTAVFMEGTRVEGQERGWEHTKVNFL